MIRRAVELRLRAQQMLKKQLQRLQTWLQVEPNPQMREI